MTPTIQKTLPKNFLTFALLAVMSWLSPSPIFGQNPAGDWKGKIETANLEFEVSLLKSSEGWSGTLSIPAQRLKDRKLVDLSFDEEGRLAFRISGIPGRPRFEGKLSDDGKTVSGTFLQGPSKLEFSMRRAKAAKQSEVAAKKKLEEALEELRDEFVVPGAAIAIVKNGEVMMARGFGKRRLDGKALVTSKTLFAIGSSTKAFTTFGLGTLAAEGKLDWDAPLRDYLPTFKLAEEEVARQMTPRDLVTHRSGLPRHDLVWYGRPDLTPKQIVDSLSELELSAGFRERFQYNNLMFVAAGHLASTIDGRSWSELTRARVTSPLGMSETVFSIAEMEKVDDHARPHAKRDKKVTEIPFREIGNIGPAGSINSNAEDMARWLLVHLEGGEIDGKRVIPEDQLQDILQPHMVIPNLPSQPEFGIESYALGWMVGSYRGALRVQHGGAIDGFLASVSFFPHHDFGVVVLANRSGAPFPEVATRLIADHLLEKDPIPWKDDMLKSISRIEGVADSMDSLDRGERIEGTQLDHPLASYVGSYRHPAYGVMAIRKDGESLSLAFNRLEAPLEHWHHEVFRCGKNERDPALKGIKIQFHSGLDGRLASLTCRLEESVEAIWFVREADESLNDPEYLRGFVGDYSIMGQQMAKLRMQGKKLALIIAGQPVWALTPTEEDGFRIDKLEGYRLRFVRDEGELKSVRLIQPQGVFEAKRIRKDQEEVKKEPAESQ